MSLNPPIDTVQEVNVLRNSFSTEYGQGQAVVSMVTKSGTNGFSGTVYEYFRNERSTRRIISRQPSPSTSATSSAPPPADR